MQNYMETYMESGMQDIEGLIIPILTLGICRQDAL